MKSFSYLFSSPSFLSFIAPLFLVFNLSQVCPSDQLITIGHNLRLHLIRTLCLHLSCSSRLRKTLTMGRYLHSGLFSTTFNAVPHTHSPPRLLLRSQIFNIPGTGAVLAARSFVGPPDSCLFMIFIFT